ncbi:MAG: sugar transferase [Actinomycetota bacterium]
MDTSLATDDTTTGGSGSTQPDLPAAYLSVKYPLSRLVAVFALVVLAPVLALIAGLVRWQLGPGVLYRQSRIGRNGNEFVILKFRTMAPDRRVGRSPVADDRRMTHKSDHDPRHHPLGRVLRATSIDELPQLWNVVRGDMTLVGPRPEITEVADRYGFRHHPRHAVLPGITGRWQVSAHRSEPLHEHIEIDRDYVDNVSLLVDARIVARSCALLLRPTGR